MCQKQTYLMYKVPASGQAVVATGVVCTFSPAVHAFSFLSRRRVSMPIARRFSSDFAELLGVERELSSTRFGCGWTKSHPILNERDKTQTKTMRFSK